MPDFLIWPAVALILGLIALLLFKPAIEKKIACISRAGKDGLSFEKPQGGDIGNPPSLLPFIEIMRQPVYITALEEEQKIKQQLGESGLKTDEDKTPVLTRALANTRVELEFNKIAQIIFGSQITLLVEIVGSKVGIQKSQAEVVFEQAQKTYPDLHANRNFSEWFSYLRVCNLAIITTDDQVDITQVGKDFLKYLVDSRSAHNRWG